MAFSTKAKLGPRSVKEPKQFKFVHGSIPSSMRAPTPKSNTRDYAKTTPSIMPETGFGETGQTRGP